MGNAEMAMPLKVQVSYSPAPREVDTVHLQLPLGSTVADALRASGLLARYGLALDEQLSVGVWTKTRPLDSVLREADRVEIYRGLKVDPKEARRQRYRKQPAKRR
ncbi:MAG TPA: RnfH family protein [Ideonella sp.]|uniref:RnfH family protein n=1 Tax=Ideonella sp. TaxID=1929293 RepID=UPI002E303A3F|nr:RnfH family protein [Ideonella sp.]HEX5684713.1 RnfH family protein [Ideonella sp.]